LTSGRRFAGLSLVSLATALATAAAFAACAEARAAMPAAPAAARLTGVHVQRAAPGLPLTPWLERLRATTAARERRDVIVAFVSERDPAKTPERARALLRNDDVRARVFAPGTMGYTFIPQRPRPVIVFVDTDRVEAPVIDLVAAHELGHVLLHSRGFLQVVMFAGDPREAPLTDAFNAVQDVLLERELAALGVNTRPLLDRQILAVSRSLSLGGPSTAPSGSLQASRLATMVAPLMLVVPDADPGKERLRELLPKAVLDLVARYGAILSAPVHTPAQYREVIYRACEANGLSRTQVTFAPD
jgi:hypothetical protein